VAESYCVLLRFQSGSLRLTLYGRVRWSSYSCVNGEDVPLSRGLVVIHLATEVSGEKNRSVL